MYCACTPIQCSQTKKYQTCLMIKKNVKQQLASKNYFLKPCTITNTRTRDKRKIAKAVIICQISWCGEGSIHMIEVKISNQNQ